MYFTEDIVPFEGTDSFKLYQHINDVKTTLEIMNIPYHEEIWQSDSETIPNPWHVISVYETIRFFFASNEKMFKIVFLKTIKESCLVKSVQVCKLVL